VDAFVQALNKGNMDPAVKLLGPDICSFAVSGPDFGFYTYPNPPEVKAFLVGQATAAGPLTVEGPATPEVEVHGQTALVHGTYQVTVSGFPVQPTETWWQLYKNGDTWMLAVVCGLRKD